MFECRRIGFDRDFACEVGAAERGVDRIVAGRELDRRARFAIFGDELGFRARGRRLENAPNQSLIDLLAVGGQQRDEFDAGAGRGLVLTGALDDGRVVRLFFAW